jgi:hypothetical protein
MRSFFVLIILVILALSAGIAGAQTGAAISITSPAPGAVLPNLNAITVIGTGTALFENSLVVQALDQGGGILSQQPVTTDAPEVGGTGSWQATLAVSVAPGTPGVIRAFATSPNDGSVVAEAMINVTYGSAPLPSVITITTPTNGTILPNVGSFAVAGSATNVFEGTVVVQARDAANNVLAQIAVIADGAALGGTGNWQGSLSVNVAAGTNGNIRAFAESPMDGSVVAEAVVNVIYGAIPADVDIAITFPANGSVVNTAGGVVVTGTTRNIPDGNVTVQLRDNNNRVLAERQVKTAPTQGDGNWQANLNAFFTFNTPGSIFAFTPGVGEGGQFLSDTIFVTFNVNCGVRSDWPVYIVQRGDTLSRIAQRVGSSTAELAQGNCLNNVNVIEVGQQLRVPRQPIIITPMPPTPAGPAVIEISSPPQGAIVDPTAPIVVRGTASGLNRVTVQALDSANNVLAAQTVVVNNTLWQASLTVGVTPGTAGRINAYTAASGSSNILASASVNVFYGQGQIVPPQTTGEVALEITNPQDNAALNTAGPVSIGGTGAGLFEGGLIVRLLDNEGRVLIEQPTTLTSAGTWTIDLPVDVQSGTRGIVYAYAISPVDGSVIVADAVNVVYGPAPAGPYVSISEPMPYSLLEVGTISLSGRGGNLFENSLVVRALDSKGNVLAEQPTTVNAAQVGAQGDWAVDLDVSATTPGTRGFIEASAQSAEDGSIVALARVPVIFGVPDASTPHIVITSPLPGTPVTAENGVVASGYAGALPAESITVQLIDSAGNILASRTAAIAEGTGAWSAELALVEGEPGTTGRLVAFASGESGAVVARDGFEIAFAGAETGAVG